MAKGRCYGERVLPSALLVSAIGFILESEPLIGCMEPLELTVPCSEMARATRSDNDEAIKPRTKTA